MFLSLREFVVLALALTLTFAASHPTLISQKTTIGAKLSAEERLTAESLAMTKLWDAALNTPNADSKELKAENKTEKVDPGAKQTNVDKDKVNATSICLDGVKDTASFDRCRLGCDSNYYAKNDTKYLECYKCCSAQLNKWSPDRCPLVDGRPCNGQGVCDEGICQCNHLFEGPSCDIVRSPREGRLAYAGDPDFAVTVISQTTAAGASVGLGNIANWSDKQQEWKFSADGRVNLMDAGGTFCLTVGGGAELPTTAGRNGLPVIIQPCSYALRRAQRWRLDRPSNRLLWVADEGYALTMSGEVAKERTRLELEQVHKDAKARQTFSFSGAGIHFVPCTVSSCNYKQVALDNALPLSCFMGTCVDNRKDLQESGTRENNLPFFTYNAGGNAQPVFQNAASGSSVHQNSAGVRFQDNNILRGIGEYPNGNITFHLQALREYGYKFNFLRARVGVDVQNGCAFYQNGVDAQVWSDGKLASNTRIVGAGESFEVKVPITSTKKIDLVTRFVNGDYCNFVVWGNIRLTLEDGSGDVAVYDGSDSNTYGGPWDGNRYVYGTTPRTMAMSTTIPVAKDDTIYSIVSCQMYNGGWGGTSLTLKPTPGSNGVDEIVKANNAYWRTTGYYMDGTSQGAYRAREDGTVQMGAEQVNYDGNWSTYWNCNLISFLVRNKNVVGASSNPARSWTDRTTTAANHPLIITDLNTKITIGPGKAAWASATCSMYVANYGTVYMRVAHDALTGAEILTQGNWITITNAWGGFSNGISQMAVRNVGKTPLTLNFYSTMHVGSHMGTYSDCNMVVRELDGTVAATNDDKGYNNVGGSRLVWSTYQWTDFDTTIDVKAGDVVYAQLSCNIWNHAWYHSQMKLGVKASTRPVTHLIDGNWMGHYYHSYWANGSSQGMWRATGDGTITFAGYYGSGYHYTTYVYCNIIANNMGRDSNI